jgi:NitT/TauT family transport system substrate-binding protein
MERAIKLSVLAAVVGCLLFLESPSAEAEMFAVGTWKTAQTIQPFFYPDFLPERMDVQTRPFTNPADQKAALLAGSLAMCGTTLAHAIHSGAMGQPVVLVAALCNKCSALVARSGEDIESAADFKGRRIGYVPGTMHEILLRETLARSGLSPHTDVRLMRVDFFDMGIALSRGSIDGFLSGEPFPTLAAEKGYGKILAYPYYDDSIGTINAGMLVTRRFLEDRPEEVYQLVKAHAMATRHLNRNPDEWLSRAAAFGTAKPVLQKAAANMELAWYMDETFVRRVRALGERMEALGLIDRQPDYERLFELSVVKRVRSELDPDD